METLIVSLTIAAVSALTYIAYKHPVGYRRIGLTLLIFVLLLSIGESAYNLGSISASMQHLQERLQTFPDNSLRSVDYSVNSLNESMRILRWVFVLTMAICIYLTFLFFLPNVLGLKTDQSPEEKEGNRS